MKEFVENTLGLKILTNEGYKEFSGVSFNGIKPVYRVVIGEDKWFEATQDHLVFDSNLGIMAVRHIEKGDFLYGLSQPYEVLDVYDTGREEAVYDIIGVDGLRFFANDVLVHNCEFLSAEATLINAQALKRIANNERDELFKQVTVRWFHKPKPNHTYVVALDPSLGTNNDFAAIQVIELPTLIQVAEWRDNKSSTHTQIETLLNILRYIYYELGNNPMQNEVPDIYWSVENNTIGEGALVCIQDTGEENFPGEFIHENVNRKMFGRRRKGLYTGTKTKLNACGRLKSLLETDRLTVYSKPLIHELKNFVAAGATFKAKQGETDDLVMSMIIAIRIVEIVSKHNEDVYDRINESVEIDDSWLEPLPILC